jgi:hypothetical protein
MIKVEISKSSGKVTHIKGDTKTTITGLPQQASLKAIIARAKGMGLEVGSVISG